MRFLVVLVDHKMSTGQGNGSSQIDEKDQEQRYLVGQRCRLVIVLQINLYSIFKNRQA
jgi:hypothetical protein